MPGGAAAAGHLPHIPGYTCNAGGTRLPLGPEVEVRLWAAAHFWVCLNVLAGSTVAARHSASTALQPSWMARQLRLPAWWTQVSCTHPSPWVLACPSLQFKIIDFGISKTSAKLAEVAGGREARVRPPAAMYLGAAVKLGADGLLYTLACVRQAVAQW